MGLDVMAGNVKSKKMKSKKKKIKRKKERRGNDRICGPAAARQPPAAARLGRWRRPASAAGGRGADRVHR
jgi:hypothetical protein